MLGRKNTIDFQRHMERLEHRLTANVEKVEQRLIANVEKVEQRLADDAKEREQRLNASIAQTNANIVQTEQRLDSKFDKLVEGTKTTHRWLIGVIVTSLLSATGVAIALISFLINGNGM